MPSLLALLLLLIAPAWAGPAEDAALHASQIRDEHCAEMAADRLSSMTGALVAVAPVLDEVSRVYEEDPAPYLLYWRGVLLQCSGQEERARSDLEAFSGEADNRQTLPDLVRDAERRIRALGGSIRHAPPPPTGPRAAVGVGGGYEVLVSPNQPHHYGALSVDGSFGIVGPLRVIAFARFAFGAPRTTADGTRRSLLIPLGAGIGLRFGDAVAFRGQLRFVVAPNQASIAGGEVLPGIEGLVGAAFRLGALPLELRPELSLGALGGFFQASAGVSVAARFGP